MNRAEHIARLTAARDELWRCRATGVREVRDQNGERILYGTDAEMAAAIRGIDAEINRLGGANPSTILFRTSKGL